MKCSEDDCTEEANWTYTYKGEKKACCGVHYHSVHNQFIAMGLAGNPYGPNAVEFTAIRAYLPETFIDWEKHARDTKSQLDSLTATHSDLCEKHQAVSSELDYVKGTTVPMLRKRIEQLMRSSFRPSAAQALERKRKSGAKGKKNPQLSADDKAPETKP